MFRLRLAITAKTCASVSVLVVLCVIAVPVYVLSQYRIDRHKWFYSHNILDLPEKDVQYFSTRRWDYDGWTPGNPKWLEDPTEFYAKLHKNESYTGTHEILYYNPRPTQRIQQENEILGACPVKNCHITDDRIKYDTSSAVIFEISHHAMPFPPRTRPLGQMWIFNDFEPPLINERWEHRHRSWNGKMNWSMSYRYDSDIIRNFGYLKTRTKDRIPKPDYHQVFTAKTKFAAWFVSNCGSMTMSDRNEYVNELKKYIPIDIYGKCGTMIADRSYQSVKNILKDYRFFLSFENSFCTDYMTEKFFQYFDITDAVLVVRGGADYDQLLPDYTHINAQHFSNARDLAQYLLSLNQSESEYIEYLKTRDKYDVVQLNWACNLCTKLNNKTAHARVYSDIVSWWHTDKCWAATDVTKFWTAKRQWIVIFLVIICILSAILFYVRQPFRGPGDIEKYIKKLLGSDKR